MPLAGRGLRPPPLPGGRVARSFSAIRWAAASLTSYGARVPDFESIIKVLVLGGGVMMILIATGFAYKGLRRRATVEPDVADKLHDLEGRLSELEERLDFTERALTEVRARRQIPKQ